MSVFLFLGLFVAAAAHNITYISVPRYGDPRAPATMHCRYILDRSDPPLHSVKWYRGKHEILRYSPAMKPSVLTFNTTMSKGVTGVCDDFSCSASVPLPLSYNTRIPFTCEVSTEGPRFAFVKQTRELTVAVALKEDPVISVMPEIVQLGDEMVINCTTGPAMPPANIVWYIDGEPRQPDPWMMNATQVSPPVDGLRRSWQALRIKAATDRETLDLRCEATQPINPPLVRVSNLTVVLAKSPHLSMFTASGSISVMDKKGLIVAIGLAALTVFKIQCLE